MPNVYYAVKSHPSSAGVQWTAWVEGSPHHEESFLANTPTHPSVKFRSAPSEAHVKAILQHWKENKGTIKKGMIQQVLHSEAKLEANLFVPWPEELANSKSVLKIDPVITQEFLDELQFKFPSLMQHMEIMSKPKDLIYDNWQLITNPKRMSVEDVFRCAYKTDTDLLCAYVTDCTYHLGSKRHYVNKELKGAIESFFEQCSDTNSIDISEYNNFTNETFGVASEDTMKAEDTNKIIDDFATWTLQRVQTWTLQRVRNAIVKLREFYCDAFKDFKLELDKPEWVDDEEWQDFVKDYLNCREKEIMIHVKNNLVFTHQESETCFLKRYQWQPEGRNLARAREKDFGNSPIKELDNKYLFKKLCCSINIPVMPSVVIARSGECEYLPKGCEEAFISNKNKRFKPLDGIDSKGQEDVVFEGYWTENHWQELEKHLDANTKRECVDFLSQLPVNDPDYRFMLENKAESTLPIGLIEFKALMINKELCLILALSKDRERLGYAFPLQTNESNKPQWVPLNSGYTYDPQGRDTAVKACLDVWKKHDVQTQILNYATPLAEHLQDVFGVSVFRVDFFALFVHPEPEPDPEPEPKSDKLMLVANEAMQWFGGSIENLHIDVNNLKDTQYHELMSVGANQVKIKLHNAVCEYFASQAAGVSKVNHSY